MARDASPWGDTEHLLALVVDEIHLSNNLFLRANVKKGVKVPEPRTIPRPGGDTVAPVRRQSTAAEVARFARGRVRFSPRRAS